MLQKVLKERSSYYSMQSNSRSVWNLQIWLVVFTLEKGSRTLCNTSEFILELEDSSYWASVAMNSGNLRMRVGKYELGKTLGEGTFAKVKFARNIDTGENVAIKILDKEKILKHKMVEQVILVRCNDAI